MDLFKRRTHGFPDFWNFMGPSALIFLLVLPAIANAQSILVFPRALAPSDLATTGFAIANPTPAPAPVSFTLYGPSGQILGISQQSVPAGGQLARLGTELFPGVTNTGWVQVNSSVAGMEGIWVGGDFTAYADGGAEAAASSSIIFPFITDKTEINLANSGGVSLNVLMRLFGEDGLELAPPALQALPPKGSFHSQVSTLFPSADLALATHIRATGGAPFAGVAVANDFLFSPSWSVMNGLPTQSSETELKFPHAIDGNIGGTTYSSVLGIANLAATAQDVTITFTSDKGAPVSVRQSLPANGALRQSVRNLFGFTGDFQNGWIEVTGNQPLAGFLAYGEGADGGVTVIPAQTSASATILFAHIADLSPWLTGLALLNAGPSSANVDVFALAPDGTLIGGADNVRTARFSIPAGTKISKLLSEIIPQTQSRNSDGGFVFIRSDTPLYGIALFFSRSLTILANIPAQTILSGITWTPPPPAR